MNTCSLPVKETGSLTETPHVGHRGLGFSEEGDPLSEEGKPLSEEGDTFLRKVTLHSGGRESGCWLGLFANPGRNSGKFRSPLPPTRPVLSTGMLCFPHTLSLGTA